MDKIKFVVVALVLAAGGYFGWTFLRDAAKSSSDEELIKTLAMTPSLNKPGQPYFEELKQRIVEEKIKPSRLKEIIDKADNDDARRVGFQAMALVPKKDNDLLKYMEHYRKANNPSKDVQVDMIKSATELALNRITHGEETIKWLVETVLNRQADQEPAVVTAAVNALKEMTGLEHETKDKWFSWYATAGHGFKIPESKYKKPASAV